VLLSDGQENTLPMIADVQDDLLTEALEVYSVGLGTDAAIDPAKLEDVAVATGGDFRMTDDPAVLQEFYLQIVATTVSGDMDASDEDVDADADADEEASVAIDWPAHLAAAAQVTVTKPRPIQVVAADRILTVVATATNTRSASFDLALVAPDGTVVTERSGDRQSGFFYRRGRNYVMMTVPCRSRVTTPGPGAPTACYPKGATSSSRSGRPRPRDQGAAQVGPPLERGHRGGHAGNGSTDHAGRVGAGEPPSRLGGFGARGLRQAAARRGELPRAVRRPSAAGIRRR
jgi:hypothetical protein